MDIRKAAALILALTVSTAAGPFRTPAKAADSSGRTAPSEVQAAPLTVVRYSEYRDQTAEDKDSTVDLTIAADSYAASRGSVQKLRRYQGRENVVLTGDDSYLEWKFTLPTDCTLDMTVSYCPSGDSVAGVTRCVLVNGEVPFEEFSSITFKRSFQDGAIRQSPNGDEVRPDSAQVYQWSTLLLQTTSSMRTQPFHLHLKAGANTIALRAVNGSMAIEKIRLCSAGEPGSYQESEAVVTGKAAAAQESVVAQAEKGVLKSDSFLYPINDHANAGTQPQSVKSLKLNTIGGQSWKEPGTWFQWNVRVKTAGYYKLSFRALQNFNVGTTSCRRVYIDGKVPYREFEEVSVKYNSSWQMVTVCNQKKQPCYIYLSEGIHTVRLETVIGRMGGVAEKAQNAVSALNALYSDIRAVTGSTPDANRDYMIEKTVPDTVAILQKNSLLLSEAEKEFEALTGGRGEDYTLLDKLRLQCVAFCGDPNQIPQSLDDFRTNISAVSEWILTAGQQPLTLDYLLLSGSKVTPPSAEAPWYRKVIFSIQSFFASFANSYDHMNASAGTGAKSTVTLWISASGRDQAQAINDLLKNDFVRKYQINVNLKLVDASMLLPAVVTGNGPDVAINQGRDMPMNYGFRGALYNLANFSDCQEVLKTYIPGATDPFVYQDAVYALPETYSVNTMFYRTDIFKRLGLSLPKTWDDVYSVISVLQNHNMYFGLPPLAENEISTFVSLLYQNGGEVYNKLKNKTDLASENSVSAFTVWTNMYTKYMVQQKLNALTRFRTGEDPIMIQPYTFYNSLIVGAPEIDGLWEMAETPGTEKENGAIDNTVMGTGTGAVMFKNARDKNSSWKFLQWWTSADVQARYDFEMEGMQGQSARMAPSTYGAIERIPWQSQARQTILRQIHHSKGLSEVPGGYMLARYVYTAASYCVNDSAPARETIADYSTLIDSEITAKRIEFGMGD